MSIYDPLRELNGETWKSFDKIELDFREDSVAGNRYIRLSPNVLLTSAMIYFSLYPGV